MASEPVTQDGKTSAEDPPAPLAGTRAQRIHRLQIGVFGLLAMVLLVGLANIVYDQARESEAAAVPEAAPTTEPEDTPVPASNPLAEAGVVPDLPAEPGPAVPPETATEQSARANDGQTP